MLALRSSFLVDDRNLGDDFVPWLRAEIALAVDAEAETPRRLVLRLRSRPAGDRKHSFALSAGAVVDRGLRAFVIMGVDDDLELAVSV
jgi:hypothetical protein